MSPGNVERTGYKRWGFSIRQMFHILGGGSGVKHLENVHVKGRKLRLVFAGGPGDESSHSESPRLNCNLR